MAKLVVQEERLIDLAADGSLPQSRIRARLNQLALDRNGIEEKLSRTGDDLAVGADLLSKSLDLARDPAELYGRAPDQARRLLNETFFERLYLDERGAVAHSQLRPPFDDFGPAVAAAYRMGREGAATAGGSPDMPRTENEALSGAEGLVSMNRTVLLDLAAVFLAGRSSKTVLVDRLVL